MKQEKKDERKLQKYLEKMGLDPTQATPLIEEVSPTKERDKNLEAEAALAYWENGRTFQEKVCKGCHQRFETNYNSIAYCSRFCVKKAVEAIGLTWHPEKSDHERWGRTPPLVVPQKVLELIEQIRSEQLLPDTVPVIAPE